MGRPPASTLASGALNAPRAKAVSELASRTRTASAAAGGCPGFAESCEAPPPQPATDNAKAVPSATAQRIPANRLITAAPQRSAEAAKVCARPDAL